MPNQEWTVRRLIEWTSDFFAEKNLNEPLLSAQILLAETLNCSKVDLYLRYENVVDKDKLAVFRGYIQRASAGEPIAYLIGHKEFFSLDMMVNSSVLVPRPETEILVQWVVRKVRSAFSNRKSIEILEIGTGSGCIAIALAKNVPGRTKIIAVDNSDKALAVARENCRRHGVEDKIVLRKSNLFEDVGMENRFDFIVSNPPYITEEDFADLPRHIKEYEPAEALYGGQNGLDVIKPIIAESYNFLAPDGYLAIEIGYNQSESVRELMQERGYEGVEFELDGLEIDRVAMCRISDRSN